MIAPPISNPTRFVPLAQELATAFAERAEETDRLSAFPFQNFADLHAAGYLSLTIPEEFGGQGATVHEFALAQEQIARACGSTGLASSMHLSLLGRTGQLGLWPNHIYAEIASAVIRSGSLINAANSEPSLGSPSRGALPSTTAHSTADGWRVNGRKKWASLAPALTWVFSLVAIHDGETEPHRGNLLIPMHSPGVSVEPTWNNLGMRGTRSDDILFEDVTVPLTALLPADTDATNSDGAAWWYVPSAAVYLGVGFAARDAAIQYANTRVPNGMPGPIAELQTIQHKIAEIELLLLQARTLLYDVAAEWSNVPERRGELLPKLTAAKLTVNRSVLRATEIALTIVGSAGLEADNPVQRHFRDARTALGHPPMEDAALTTIGKAALSQWHDTHV